VAQLLKSRRNGAARTALPPTPRPEVGTSPMPQPQ